MKRIKHRLPCAEDRAWLRGSTRAVEVHGYVGGETSIRDSRIYAMAYSEGFVNGKKAEQARTRRAEYNQEPCPDCGTQCNDHTKHCTY